MQSAGHEYFRCDEPAEVGRSTQVGWITALVCVCFLGAAVMNWSGRESTRTMSPQEAWRVLEGARSFGDAERSAQTVSEVLARTSIERMVDLTRNIEQDPDGMAALSISLERIERALRVLRSALDDRPESQHQPTDDGK